MRRDSPRELAATLDELATEAGVDERDTVIVWENPDTGDWYADPDDDEPIPPETVGGADPLVIMQEQVIETGWSPNGHQEP